MSQNLTDIHATMNNVLEGNELLHFVLEPCATNTNIYPHSIIITPLWLRKKNQAEQKARIEAERIQKEKAKAEELARLEKERIQKEKELQKQRLQRGTGTPVDLGLSVLWSSRNVGAPSGEQPGLYVGWGDVSACKTSLNYDEYPTANPPLQISGSQYDFARAQWAEKWRIPTLKEMSELMQNCQWMWTVIKGVPGFQVIGKTGQSIFLPAGGDRYGLQYEDAYYVGRYWTSDLYPEETARAFFLEFNQQMAQINTMARYMGMLIRPVLEREI